MMGRREFLKSIGAMAAGLMAARVPLPKNEGAEMPTVPPDLIDIPVPDVIDMACNDPPWFVVLGEDRLPRVSYDLMTEFPIWHEIELYGYWSRDDLPCGNHYSMNLDPPIYVSVLGRASRPVLPWEWAWYMEYKDSDIPWWEVSQFPITDNERIEALGRYLGYLWL